MVVLHCNNLLLIFGLVSGLVCVGEDHSLSSYTTSVMLQRLTEYIEVGPPAGFTSSANADATSPLQPWYRGFVELATAELQGSRESFTQKLLRCRQETNLRKFRYVQTISAELSFYIKRWKISDRMINM